MEFRQSTVKEGLLRPNLNPKLIASILLAVHQQNMAVQNDDAP